jgi:tRNA threonylcarbamoyladenosine biosynthesis protein TsaB
MLVAALDTATLTLSCALVDVVAGAPPRLRCDRTITTGGRSVPSGGTLDSLRSSRPPPSPPLARPRSHSAELPQALVDLLDAEGLEIPDVEAYAVGLGPGSFTGLRIGLATWKGLAYANRRPIAGGSSLAAMALAAAPDAEEGALLVPLLDARKGEVYAGFYRVRDGAIVETAADADLAPQALVARVAALAAGGARPFVFGQGLLAYRDVLSDLPRLATEVTTPPAFAVAAILAESLAGAVYDAQALFALEPHYVRASEAEVKFPKGLGPGADKG